ncbi:hypothetical protein [Herbidospora mongoliensis]|uniref:hypothetical protein n=1 Tax=Herbidospora mongoliensis TaxID=688067 RepID=UPI000832B16F|nr:hypothetical protein [Herbidospora mongoliensis]
MTEAARRQHILKALEAHGQLENGERRPFPLSRGSTNLPVVTLPLSVPILNAKSFRIAPALADHSSSEAVAADPESPAAQKLIAELVSESHKFAEELKRSLREEGQDEPGIITRSGVLINANTRCVLMRELLAEGELRNDAIRVAVLPSDTGPGELYDLEAVVQKQRDHKDDYDLVSELMMLRTLHEEGQMTEQQIAKRQRLNPKDVVLRFRLLALMDRARVLVDPPIPIKSFGSGRKKGALQNWRELDTRVQAIDEREGPEAGDDHIREWLHLHLLDMGSVHNLRVATQGWVNKHLMNALTHGGEIGTKIAAAATDTKPALEPKTDPGGDGLDLLDFGRSSEDKPAGNAVRSLLNLTIAATNAGPRGVVELPDGSRHSGNEILKVLRDTTDAGLKDSSMRIDAGEKLEAPSRLIEKAHAALVAANKAIYDVQDQVEFAKAAEGVTSLLDDLVVQIDEAREALEQITARHS